MCYILDSRDSGESDETRIIGLQSKTRYDSGELCWFIRSLEDGVSDWTSLMSKFISIFNVLLFLASDLKPNLLKLMGRLTSQVSYLISI